MHRAMCVSWLGTYGFLRIEGFGKDIFVHYEELLLDWHFRKLYEGEEVLVETTEETPKGPVAKRVHLASLEEYQRAKVALERVLTDVEQKLKTKREEWSVLGELAQIVRHAREEHYAAYMRLHEKRRAEIWLRVPYSNLRDDSREVLASCEETREGRITLVQAVKTVSCALKITERGKSNAQALRVHCKRLLKLRNAGVMVYEVDKALKAIAAECERQIAEGRNRRETKRLRYLADDLVRDLGLDEN